MSANATSGTLSLAEFGPEPPVNDGYSCAFLPCPAGTVFGADDFLPCLTWVLLRSDVVTLQIDTDYMMELLDPTQLQGEGKAALYEDSEAFKLLLNVEIRIVSHLLSPSLHTNRWLLPDNPLCLPVLH